MPKLTIGDRVEYSPGMGVELPDRRGEDAELIAHQASRSVIRFDDGFQAEVWTSTLAWVPRPEEIEAGAEALRAAFLRERRGMDSLSREGRQSSKAPVRMREGRQNRKPLLG